MRKAPSSYDWEKLLAHAAILQAKVPSAIQRRIRGKLVLGEIDGIDAGLRNQRRSAPLETTSIKAPGGRELKVPTIEEMLRIKTFLVVERNATRDYLDVAALSHHLGTAKSVHAIVEEQCRTVAIAILRKAPPEAP